MNSALFLHAHPDDESIFTGGTISLLAKLGHEITLVFATGGELGIDTDDEFELVHHRQKEARNSAKILGVDNVYFLDFHDSGLDAKNFPANAFATCDVGSAARKLNQIVENHNVDSLFCDDSFGVYGHPDHLQAHQVATKAAEIGRIDELYFHTVDREYLHFVETHLVEEAHLSHPHESEAKQGHIGMSSIEITHTIDIASEIDTKRASMTAHRSQISDTSSAFSLNDSDFRNVYGYEWFVCAKSPKDSERILDNLPRR